MPRLWLLGTSLKMEIPNPFDLILIENSGEPFCEGNNDYKCFETLKGCSGIYVIQHKETKEVLYIGEAQDLKDRIIQNYTENNTGGTFRINWCKKEMKNFEQFKSFLPFCTIKAVSINVECKYLILAIEAIFISALNPKYNN